MESNHHSTQAADLQSVGFTYTQPPQIQKRCKSSVETNANNGASSYDTFNKLVTNPAVVGIIQ